jgi:hypothetical protein
MKRRRVLITSVSLGVLLSVTMLAIRAFDNRSSKVTVSFVNSETSYGPPFSNVECQRLAFDVRNAGSKPTSFNVYEIADAHGNWAPSLHFLGDAETGPSTRLYLYLPLGSHPQSLRIRMLRKASAVQKTQYALRLLIDKAFGRYPGKQVWFDGLRVPACVFTVKLDK